MSDFEFTRLFDMMMHINEIISIFLYGRRYPLFKDVYNNLTAKNHFVIKCTRSAILEEEKSPL